MQGAMTDIFRGPRLGFLAAKLLVFAYLGTLVVYLAFDYTEAAQKTSPPFPLFVMDTVNLFIHEAGHLFFRIFGQWVHILGGSLLQCLLPLALLVVTWRQNIHQIPWPAFWLGESMVNVSVYIRDAPVRHLKLIASGLIHDWWWLLQDNLEWAEPLADGVFALGLQVCTRGIAGGVWLAFLRYREDTVADTMPLPALQRRSASRTAAESRGMSGWEDSSSA
jgi:hypothetical protein